MLHTRYIIHNYLYTLIRDFVIILLNSIKIIDLTSEPREHLKVSDIMEHDRANRSVFSLLDQLGSKIGYMEAILHCRPHIISWRFWWHTGTIFRPNAFASQVIPPIMAMM